MPKNIGLIVYIHFLLVVFGVITVGHAQKEPQYTQYMYNIGSFNPAYVGTVESPEIAGLYRVQWVDIPGAPTTMRFGANIPFGNEKMGLGFNVVNDQLGPSDQTFIDVSYSYQINISDITKLSFGMAAGGSLLNLDYSEGTVNNPLDPVLGNENVSNFYPTVGAGLFLYEEDWYTGISVPNFLTNGLYNDEVATIVEDNLQFNLIGGYVFQLSDRTKFKPAFLLNYLQNSPLNINISANFQFIDALTIGAAYRFDNAVSGLAGFQISNGLFIGYSYDYNTNALGEFSGGSHEAILKFYIGRGGFGSGNSKGNRDKKLKGKPKQIDSPRFF
ncbi:type IX secretion system membrane protein PorP/SprF [Flagellimonas sp. HMM57]|uniref:PorP/SprF family type IX secretion system membrane protein n=1 Tax=unclassified Flagellimonas TaxID=2644544 RepID=UPI0013D701FD|nr:MULTISPECIES: type IX secretion system membrane protein PorP/SprF [unclassified Flagellimonas]UII76937.1 type IX secretion system membrane protein PorP/SprF [Flagellimonas sp. HMM57]